MTLLLYSCEKKQESYQYEKIDLIELSTNFGIPREEINNKYSGCLIDEFLLVDDFLIKTEAGNYSLRIRYHYLMNENNEYIYPAIPLTFKMNGEISTSSRTASVRQLEDIIHNNFENFLPQAFNNLGYGGYSGTEIKFENNEELLNAIRQNKDEYRLIWTEGKITYTLFVFDKDIPFSIESEDYIMKFPTQLANLTIR